MVNLSIRHRILGEMGMGRPLGLVRRHVLHHRQQGHLLLLLPLILPLILFLHQEGVDSSSVVIVAGRKWGTKLFHWLPAERFSNPGNWLGGVVPCAEDSVRLDGGNSADSDISVAVVDESLQVLLAFFCVNFF